MADVCIPEQYEGFGAVQNSSPEIHNRMDFWNGKTSDRFICDDVWLTDYRSGVKSSGGCAGHFSGHLTCRRTKLAFIASIRSFAYINTLLISWNPAKLRGCVM